MSPREELTRERLQKLLGELDRRFRHPARLYLSGGDGRVRRESDPARFRKAIEVALAP
jgi:hypothetical protein